MRNKAKKVLLQILWRSKTETPEFFLSVGLTLWGFWLILPNDVFGLPSFYYFSIIARELLWGVVVFSTGLFGLFAVLTQITKLRRIFAFLSTFFWLLITSIFALSASSSTAVPIYFLFTVSSLWIFIRLRFTSRIDFSTELLDNGDIYIVSDEP